MREGWEYKKLGEVCEIVMGQSPDGNSINENEGIEFHQGKTCFGERFLNSSNLYTNKPTKYAESNSVLLCVRAPVGFPNITKRKICIGRGLCSLFSKGYINNNYLYYALLGKQNYFEKNATGSTFKAISSKIVSNAQIPVPSLSTQESIVSELDKINELISLKKEQLKDYDNLAQSIFYDMFGDPITNEKGWDTNKLETLTKSEGGGTPSKSKPEYWNGNIIWVSSKDMKSTYISDSLIHITQEGVNNSPAHLLPIGTILIVNRSGILKHTLPIAITTKEVTINQDIKALVVNSSKTNNIYLLYCLKACSPFLLSKVKAVTVDSIDFAIFKKLPIPLPPLPLQQAFAKRIEAIEQQKQLISSEIKDLETLLASRMQYWFD